MHESAEVKDTAVVRRHRTSPLCWAARLLALGYGVLIALYVLAAWIMIAIGHLSRGETAASINALLYCLPFLAPLALAAIAWRWHLVGGTLITAGSAALYLFFIFSGHMQWGICIYVVPLLAGGVLHLVVWYKESRAERTPQPA